MKLYCQCFSGSTTCGPTCRCDDCHNLPEFAITIDEARRSICHRRPLAFDRKQVQSPDQEQGSTASSVPSSALASISRVGCKCRRSNCLKKYCEVSSLLGNFKSCNNTGAFRLICFLVPSAIHSATRHPRIARTNIASVSTVETLERMPTATIENLSLRGHNFIWNSSIDDNRSLTLPVT